MTLQDIKDIIIESNNRENLIERLLLKQKVKQFAEVGVYKGDLSVYLLNKVDTIQKYTLIDPWRHLKDWNKPFNQSKESFEAVYLEAMNKVSFAQSKVKVLKGKTQEVAEKIETRSLDAIYIDGDHTLKGITIDLIQMWDKLSDKGILIGDDFYPTLKRKNFNYEPTLVFPYAVYFAEAKDVKIYALPFYQFLICKNQKGFEFIDLTEMYTKVEMKPLIEEIMYTQAASNGLLNKLKRKLKRLFR